jgi:hypothetical protein
MVVQFYLTVQDQVDMGGAPRIEGYEAALRLHGWPRRHWSWLTTTAVQLHRLITKQDQVNWKLELGKRFADVTPEDVTDGDPQ